MQIGEGARFTWVLIQHQTHDSWEGVLTCGNFFFSSPRIDRKRKYYITLSLGSGPDHKPPPPFFNSWHIPNSLSSLLLGLSHDTWDTWEPIACHPCHYLTWRFCFSEATPSHHSRKNSCSTAMKRRCCRRVNSATTVV